MQTRALAARLPIFLAVLASLASSAAAAEWTQLNGNHLELYASGSEQQARAALATFEEAQSYFASLPAFSFRPEGSIRVIAFNSKEAYAPFRLHQEAFAHYFRSHDRDYIVLQDLRPEHRQVLIHEFTHYVARRSGLNLPVWLSEGIADYYSSLTLLNGTVSVGAPLVPRLITLRQQQWIPLAQVLSTTRNSPSLDESETISGFYAESWALTHMLSRRPAYASRFAEVVKAISNGADSALTLQTTYGKAVSELEQDLRQHVAGLLGLREEEPATNSTQLSMAAMRNPGASEIDFLLADLLAAQPWTRNRAEESLLALGRRFPDAPEVDEMMGSLAYQRNQLAEARAHFARAVTLGTKNPETLYRLAQIERKSGAPNRQVISLLESALAINPAHQDAAFNLAVLRFNEQEFSAAQAALTAVHSVRPEWEYTYYSLRAYCDLQAHRAAQARMFGRLAKQHAATAQENAQADHLLQQVETAGAE